MLEKLLDNKVKILIAGAIVVAAGIAYKVWFDRRRTNDPKPAPEPVDNDLN